MLKNKKRFKNAHPQVSIQGAWVSGPEASDPKEVSEDSPVGSVCEHLK